MKRLPFLLAPAPKDYLWGGTRLHDEYGKALSCSPLAESWECSTHPDGQSLVASGDFTGTKLGDLLSNQPDLLGTHPLLLTDGRAELPILIKLIDAKEKLSVQVHPDDDYARLHEHDSGKTELWYILHAGKQAEIVYGFRRTMTASQVRDTISRGTIESCLNHIPVHKNDLFFIPAGTVHEIGAGVLLAEIQQSSNLTYRLYDYDRTDRNGLHRPLHIDKALDVATLSAVSEPRQPMRLLRYQRGCASELLSRCRYFQVERLLLNTESFRGLTDFQTGPNSFHALLCTDGCGVLFGENFMLNFFKGDCIFVPAESIPLKMHGRAQLLNISS
jgi:mannose-6-phosphate isomerase